MNLQRMDLSTLRGAEYNPRKDLQPEDPEFQKIRRSIQEFGCVEPIIWNKQTGHIVGGHQRLKVLLDLGETEGDVVVIDCTLREEKILNVMLNRTKGRWDNEKLAALMQELSKAGEIELTGFDEWELQGLLDDYSKLDDVLAFDDGGDDNGEEEPDEPETFEMAFSIPVEYADDVKLYLDTEEEAEAELASAVLSYIREGA